MKILICILTTSFLFLGCGKFLDMKPDKKMSVPKTLEDTELLLNDYSSFNMAYPAVGIIAGENYHLTTSDWINISVLDDRNAYIWSDEPAIIATSWQGPYKVVYLANQVLQVLDELPAIEKESNRFKAAYGHALFLRAFAFQQLVEAYTLPYNKATADHDLGIPLRLSPNLDVVSKRSSLNESYAQIIDDYTKAADLLENKIIIKGAVSKVSAYAGLARLYLDMKDYELAFKYAELAWNMQPQLLDYNALERADSYPVPRFNKEVLFSAIASYSEAFAYYYVRMNPDFISSYSTDDLRKAIYFQPNFSEPSYFGFKGSYDQGISMFVGLTTSEILLIHAESAVRIGKIDKAVADINLLRASRWEDNKYPEVIEQDKAKLLDTVLAEREKELVFRGRRWADIKRLSDDPERAIALQRTIDGKEYTVPVGSLKYALMIPYVVTQQNPNIEQNRR